MMEEEASELAACVAADARDGDANGRGRRSGPLAGGLF
jgi:hypothetical protein